jgi:hypothetical protein
LRSGSFPQNSGKTRDENGITGVPGRWQSFYWIKGKARPPLLKAEQEISAPVNAGEKAKAVYLKAVA